MLAVGAIVAIGNHVGNFMPINPTGSMPSGKVLGSSVVALNGSAFSDPDAEDTQTAAQWQITTTAGNYSSPVYDSGTDTTNKTSISVAGTYFSNNTTYYWHVRYEDNHLAWSDYSTETSFLYDDGTTSTSCTPNTPNNTSPVNGATDVSLTHTLKASNYFCDGSTHKSSQWQVRVDGGQFGEATGYDSGETGAGTEHSIPFGKLKPDTKYWWHVRFKAKNGNWGVFSTQTSFTTSKEALSCGGTCPTQEIYLSSGDIAQRLFKIGTNGNTQFLGDLDPPYVGSLALSAEGNLVGIGSTASSGANRRFLKINKTNAKTEDLGQTVDAVSLAFAPDGKLYATDTDRAVRLTGKANLYQLNPSNGAVIKTITTDSRFSYNDIAISGNGGIYGWRASDKSLYLIDPNSGNTSKIGNGNTGVFLTGLAFIDNQLWGSGQDNSRKDSPFVLAQYNTTTGEVVQIIDLKTITGKDFHGTGDLAAAPPAQLSLSRPDKPKNITPINVSYRSDNLDGPGRLVASTYTDPGNQTHTNDQFQIRESIGTYDHLYYDSQALDITGLNPSDQTILLFGNQAPGLEFKKGRQYFWRVRYQNAQGNWSDWSDETTFRFTNGYTYLTAPAGLQCFSRDTSEIDVRWMNIDDVKTISLYVSNPNVTDLSNTTAIANRIPARPTETRIQLPSDLRQQNDQLKIILRSYDSDGGTNNDASVLINLACQPLPPAPEGGTILLTNASQDKQNSWLYSADFKMDIKPVSRVELYAGAIGANSNRLFAILNASARDQAKIGSSNLPKLSNPISLTKRWTTAVPNSAALDANEQYAYSSQYCVDTQSAGAKVTQTNIDTGEVKVVARGGSSTCGHDDLAIDKDGMVWGWLAGHIEKINPQTGEVTKFPTNNAAGLNSGLFFADNRLFGVNMFTNSLYEWSLTTGQPTFIASNPNFVWPIRWGDAAYAKNKVIINPPSDCPGCSWIENIISRLAGWLDESAVPIAAIIAGILALAAAWPTAARSGAIGQAASIINHVRNWFVVLPNKRYRNGIVFDIKTHAPIAGATIRIYDAMFDKIRATQISDKNGCFSILVPTGEYRLEIEKDGFLFPPRDLTSDLNNEFWQPGKKIGEFTNIYTGGRIMITGHKTQALLISVPMEPTFEQQPESSIRFIRNSTNYFNAIWLPLLLISTILAIYNLVHNRSPFNIAIAVYNAALWIININVSFKPRATGRVIDQNGHGIGLATVRIFELQPNNTKRLVKTVVTEDDGQFAAPTGKGYFSLEIRKYGFEPYRTEPHKISRHSTLNADFTLNTTVNNPI